MKPPFPYFGGKQTLADRIVSLLPEHEHYVEPYCGSLAVLLAKARSTMETVNDADIELMTFWRVLRDRLADLEVVCTLTPHSRAEHVAAFEPAADDLEVARRVWVRLTQGRSARLDPTGWRWSGLDHGCSTMPEYLRGYLGRFAPVAGRLYGVSLDARPALKVIEAYGQHPGTLLYLDPPYLGATRATNYRVEMTSEADHRALAEAVRDLPAAVVLSGYHSPLYGELYDGWDRVEIASHTAQGGKGAARTEVLWSNRPLGDWTLFGRGA